MLFHKKNKESIPSRHPKDKERQAFIQPKLKVGKSGDKYEIEADKMADQVVNKETRSNTVQKKEGEEEVQQKTLASYISPLVQMKDASEEEPIQKAKEQEESVQAKEEEEPIQKLEEEDTVQKKLEEEVQTKEDEEVQAKSNETTTNSSLQAKLRKGSGGSKMDTQTQNQMESGFGTDLSQVNIHTDSEAAQMSQDVGAQAFTHGNDVYFNKGKYNPDSKEGKHLLAHELTHTIQQKGMMQKKIQKKEFKSYRFKGNAKLEEVLNGKFLVKKQKGEFAHVRIIQQALIDAGFELPKYGVDGKFGKETLAAVKAFQRKNKQFVKGKETGIVGKETMKNLDKSYIGYKTEYKKIAGLSKSDFIDWKREVTKDEGKAVAEAMSTELKSDPKTGKLPVFDIINSSMYKKELYDRTEEIALIQYKKFGERKDELRKHKKNLFNPNSFNGFAEASKNETDKVFGKFNKGVQLSFGKGIYDGWAEKENRLKSKSKKEQDRIKKEWAEWRIRKIIQGNYVSDINKKYNAIQNRSTEKAIVFSVIDDLSKKYKDEMVLTHLGWPGYSSDGKVYLQLYKNNDKDKNRLFMWENFYTVVHEYIHTLEHSNSKSYSSSLEEKKGGKVLREGITDYFTKIVLHNVDFKDNKLRNQVEGDFYDKTKTDIPKQHYYSEAINAEKMAGIIGISNLIAYFFLGRKDLLKGK